uniref:Uncharacterized protein n=1 Tax=Rhizophora mucronata TaxID=61149 RepID=A0A2P2QGX1_RHIMU
MSMSIPFHALPPFIESSVSTLPTLSRTRSTKYGVRCINNVTP